MQITNAEAVREDSVWKNKVIWVSKYTHRTCIVVPEVDIKPTEYKLAHDHNKFRQYLQPLTKNGKPSVNQSKWICIGYSNIPGCFDQRVNLFDNEQDCKDSYVDSLEEFRDIVLKSLEDLEKQIKDVELRIAKAK